MPARVLLRYMGNVTFSMGITMFFPFISVITGMFILPLTIYSRPMPMRGKPCPRTASACERYIFSCALSCCNRGEALSSFPQSTTGNGRMLMESGNTSLLSASRCMSKLSCRHCNFSLSRKLSICSWRRNSSAWRRSWSLILLFFIPSAVRYCISATCSISFNVLRFSRTLFSCCRVKRISYHCFCTSNTRERPSSLNLWYIASACHCCAIRTDFNVPNHGNICIIDNVSICLLFEWCIACG